ncbi:conserved hypothetical protein [Vibrio chagasii]|nr:conserved hypothetical protein [Vibrio chagasii]
MAASLSDVQGWVKRGKEQGAAYVISVCDTFDWDDYPVFVMPEDDLHAKKAEYDGVNMQRINEVIDLAEH